jgi:hypothetical protein
MQTNSAGHTQTDEVDTNTQRQRPVASPRRRRAVRQVDLLWWACAVRLIRDRGSPATPLCLCRPAASSLSVPLAAMSLLSNDNAISPEQNADAARLSDNPAATIQYVGDWPALNDTQLAVIIGINVGSFILAWILLRLVWKPPTDKQIRSVQNTERRTLVECVLRAVTGPGSNG